jgi:hypothetical protein
VPREPRVYVDAGELLAQDGEARDLLFAQVQLDGQ